MGEEVFKAGKWYSEIRILRDSYKQVHSFITKPEVIDKHLEFKRPIKLSKDKEWVPVTDEETIKYLQGSVVTDLKRADEFYTRQMIVSVNTYIELILENFLVAFFNKIPARMGKFIDSGKEHQGLVSVKNIVKATSLADLINDLSKQATTNALSGKFKTNLRNLSNITRDKIPETLEDELVEVVELRNRIVHEVSQDKVSENTVYQALESCFSLLRFLIDIAKKNDVQIDVDFTKFASILESL